MVDEGYSVVAAHVDEVTYDKIIQGRYVDFSKLIPKDKIAEEEDDLLQLVRKNSRTFYAPVKDGTVINNFARWEQVFRVFSNIYTQEYPHRSSQLIQYNHVISDISQTYIWSNVYSYDKDFRIHMSKNPQRSWGIILQQSWSLRLREKLITDISYRNSSVGNGENGAFGPRGKTGEICRRFNRGRCNFGANCMFEHKCSYCLKYGHYVLNCRWAASDKNDRNHARGYSKNDRGTGDGGNEKGNRDDGRNRH